MKTTDKITHHWQLDVYKLSVEAAMRLERLAPDHHVAAAEPFDVLPARVRFPLSDAAASARVCVASAVNSSIVLVFSRAAPTVSRSCTRVPLASACARRRSA